MSSIRPCRDNEHITVLEIVNAAAEAYRGAIPEDCWHEPYMPLDELEREIAAGVKFWGYEADGALVRARGRIVSMSAEECRANAERCEQMAESLAPDNAGLRDTMREVAAQLRQLAADAEAPRRSLLT